MPPAVNTATAEVVVVERSLCRSERTVDRTVGSHGPTCSNTNDANTSSSNSQHLRDNCHLNFPNSSSVFRTSRSKLFEDRDLSYRLPPIPAVFPKGWPDYRAAFRVHCLEDLRSKFSDSSRNLNGDPDRRFHRGYLHSIAKPTSTRFGEPHTLLMSFQQREQVGEDMDGPDFQTGDVCLVSSRDLNGHRNAAPLCGWLLIIKTQRTSNEVQFTCHVWEPPRELRSSEKVYCAMVNSALPTERMMECFSDEARFKNVNLRLARTLFEGRKQFEHDDLPNMPDLKRRIAETPAFRQWVSYLNEAQVQAVLNCVLTATTEGIELIQGPAGTGKTHTILSILALLRLSVAEKRILVCAPTNIATADIAKKLAAMDCPHIFHLDLLVVCTRNRCAENFGPNTDAEGMTLNYRVNYVTETLTLLGKKLQQVFTGIRAQAEQSREAVRDTAKSLHAAVSFAAEKLWFMKATPEIRLLIDLFEISAMLESASSANQVSDQAALTAIAKTRNLLSDINAQVPSTIHKIGAGQVPRFCKDLGSWFLERAKIVFSTLSTSMSHRLTGWEFDVVIVDEAVQAAEAEMIGLFRGKITSLILVGDPQQQPAPVFGRHLTEVRYNRSLFERLVLNKYPVNFLTFQYRMLPVICQFPSQAFYDDRLGTDESARGFVSPWQRRFKPLSVFTYPWRMAANSVQHVGRSVSNVYEAWTVYHLLSLFFAEPGTERLTVGIVCLYRAQKLVLRECLSRLPSHQRERVDVQTVGGIQGQERDVVVVSLATMTAFSTFATDPRRVNVMVTRGRMGMWVVGGDILLQSPNGKAWYELWRRARDCGGWAQWTGVERWPFYYYEGRHRGERENTYVEWSAGANMNAGTATLDDDVPLADVQSIVDSNEFIARNDIIETAPINAGLSGLAKHREQSLEPGQLEDNMDEITLQEPAREQSLPNTLMANEREDSIVSLSDMELCSTSTSSDMELCSPPFVTRTIDLAPRTPEPFNDARTLVGSPCREAPAPALNAPRTPQTLSNAATPAGSPSSAPPCTALTVAVPPPADGIRVVLALTMVDDINAASAEEVELLKNDLAKFSSGRGTGIVSFQIGRDRAFFKGRTQLEWTQRMLFWTMEVRHGAESMLEVCRWVEPCKMPVEWMEI
ncbi:hypothetical protein HDU96_008797 [Phlyctochytrium bullatum]|nr:hypothetical protein HDU96_008797 [Phlyctochytrium bullatum]